MASAEVTMVPQNYIEVTDPEAVKKINKMLDMFDDNDDVQDASTTTPSCRRKKSRNIKHSL